MTYLLILLKPASTIVSYNEGYCHLPTPLYPQVPPGEPLCDPVLKLLRDRSILGVTTHVSAPNNKTAWVTALKKLPDTFGSAHPRIKIRNNPPPNSYLPYEFCLPLQASHTIDTFFIPSVITANNKR